KKHSVMNQQTPDELIYEYTIQSTGATSYGVPALDALLSGVADIPPQGGPVRPRLPGADRRREARSIPVCGSAVSSAVVLHRARPSSPRDPRSTRHRTGHRMTPTNRGGRNDWRGMGTRSECLFLGARGRLLRRAVHDHSPDAGSDGRPDLSEFHGSVPSVRGPWLGTGVQPRLGVRTRSRGSRRAGASLG